LKPCWAESDLIFGLPKNEVLYSNPEKALRDNKPVRIEREAIEIKSWGLWLLAEKYLYYEGGGYSLTLRKNDGTVVVKYPGINGPFILSESQKRLLACEISSHYEIENAILFDNAGNKIKEIPRMTYTCDCGKTDDDSLFWLLYNIVEDMKPINIVRFIDSNGNIVHEVKQFKAGTVSFEHKGIKYKLNFADPKYPG
jgi:hypothetical protein